MALMNHQSRQSPFYAPENAGLAVRAGVPGRSK